MKEHHMNVLLDAHFLQLTFRRSVISSDNEIVERRAHRFEVLIRPLKIRLNPSEDFLLIHFFRFHSTPTVSLGKLSSPAKVRRPNFFLSRPRVSVTLSTNLSIAPSISTSHWLQ